MTDWKNKFHTADGWNRQFLVAAEDCWLLSAAAGFSVPVSVVVQPDPAGMP